MRFYERVAKRCLQWLNNAGEDEQEERGEEEEEV